MPENAVSACFYAPSIVAPGEELTLDERESHHAEAARRLRVGDSVHLIDGAGVLATGSIESLSRKHIAVRIRSRRCCQRQTPEVHIACAPLAADRQRLLLDMLTQLGIHGYIPLAAERAARPRQADRLERWQRICLQACKQSGNPWLPELRTVHTPLDLVMAEVARGARVVVAEPGAAPLQAHPLHRPATVLVGPEGGFTGGELRAMTLAGAEQAGLGGHTLRVETAAIAAVVTLRALVSAAGEADGG